jgi:hypothetical protein
LLVAVAVVLNYLPPAGVVVVQVATDALLVVKVLVATLLLNLHLRLH